MGKTIGVEYLNGETTTPLSIKTAGQTFETFVVIDDVPTVLPSGDPARIGVALDATTVGNVPGTPGEWLTCAITARHQSR